MPDQVLPVLFILIGAIVIAIIVILVALFTMAKWGDALARLADEIASARELFDPTVETCKSCGGDGEVVKENPLLKSIRKAIDAGVKA